MSTAKPQLQLTADEQQRLDTLLDFDSGAPASSPPTDGPQAPADGGLRRRQPLLRTSELAKADHFLDSAPVGSKIVVTDRGAVIATPEIRGKILPAGDAAHDMTIGTKISKIGKGRLRGELVVEGNERVIFSGSRTNAVLAEMSHRLHDRPESAE